MGDKEKIKWLDTEFSIHGIPFLMAATHLIDIGFRNAEKMTDEEIKLDIQEMKKMEESGTILGITPEFCGWLNEKAREIAKTVSIIIFLQWFEMNKPYDVKMYKEN